jgi:hypothetical protein
MKVGTWEGKMLCVRRSERVTRHRSRATDQGTADDRGWTLIHGLAIPPNQVLISVASVSLW